jgi:DNA-binding response OmpR family regulator
MQPHVLLIEDEPEVRKALRQVLENEGYEVTTCREGGDALEWMREVDDGDLDAIVLDLLLPDMDGRDVRESQLEEGLQEDVPVVILSGADRDMEVEKREIEARGALLKPVRPSQLLETLGQHV